MTRNALMDTADIMRLYEEPKPRNALMDLYSKTLPQGLGWLLGNVVARGRQEYADPVGRASDVAEAATAGIVSVPDDIARIFGAEIYGPETRQSLDESMGKDMWAALAAPFAVGGGNALMGAVLRAPRTTTATGAALASAAVPSSAADGELIVPPPPVRRPTSTERAEELAFERKLEEMRVQGANDAEIAGAKERARILADQEAAAKKAQLPFAQRNEWYNDYALPAAYFLATAIPATHQLAKATRAASPVARAARDVTRTARTATNSALDAKAAGVAAKQYDDALAAMPDPWKVSGGDIASTAVGGGTLTGTMMLPSVADYYTMPSDSEAYQEAAKDMTPEGFMQRMFGSTAAGATFAAGGGLVGRAVGNARVPRPAPGAYPRAVAAGRLSDPGTLADLEAANNALMLNARSGAELAAASSRAAGTQARLNEVSRLKGDRRIMQHENDLSTAQLNREIDAVDRANVLDDVQNVVDAQAIGDGSLFTQGALSTRRALSGPRPQGGPSAPSSSTATPAPGVSPASPPVSQQGGTPTPSPSPPAGGPVSSSTSRSPSSKGTRAEQRAVLQALISGKTLTKPQQAIKQHLDQVSADAGGLTHRQMLDMLEGGNFRGTFVVPAAIAGGASASAPTFDDLLAEYAGLVRDMDGDGDVDADDLALMLQSQR